MSMLAGLKTDESIQNETDSVGGRGPKESGLYPFTVDMAYLMKSRSGALGMNLTLKFDDGSEHRETVYMTSGDAKGNKNYYENANGEKRYLPGFNVGNSLALLTTGKEIGELDTEKKTVKVYSPEAQAEVPTEVDVVTDLMGQRGIVGLLKCIVDKRQKADDGSYQPTGETREINEIDKIFRERDQMTTAEIRAGAEEPSFYNTWDQKWTGQVRNKASAANDSNGAAGAPGAGGPAGGGQPAGGNSKPAGSLFG